jgi:pimeloyl-ACP methyl ester carboxylesterase
LSGERDGCIASDVFEQLMVEQDFPQGLIFSRIPQAGHFLHQEQPGRVNREIVDWLTLNDERLASHG